MQIDDGTATAEGLRMTGRRLILHITTPTLWADAQRAGSYTADSLATEGFIHCSEPAQLAWVADRHFAGRTDLIVLHIDPARLSADIRYENLEGGTQLFPHVYGPIPCAAVIDVTALDERNRRTDRSSP